MNRNFMLVELSVAYNRRLKHARMKELIAIASEARAYFYKHSLAWGTDGVQVMPVCLFPKCQFVMVDTATRFRELAMEMGMIMAGIYVRYMPYPNSQAFYDNDIRPHFIRDEEYRLFRARCDLTYKIDDVLEKLHDKLKVVHTGGVVKVRKFHDTIFTTVQEDCTLFNLLNELDPDGIIQEVIESLNELATSYTPKEVRKDAALRAKLLNQVEAIQELMSKT
jgi:hypothetical protein